MNTHEGYSKKKLSNDNVLLAGGGEKSLADFLGSIRISSSKIQYKAADVAATWTDLITLVNTDENVKQTPKTDNVNRPLMMINGGTTAGELTSTSMFSTGIYANASSKMITANGFIKNGYDDTSVLLAGGGAKALTDFAMSDAYVKKIGDTMTGTLTMSNCMIWVQSASAAGNSSNRMGLSAGMPSGMPYNTSKRGLLLYANAIAICDPYNGNSNNDSCWIRHLEETANTGLMEIAVGDDGGNEYIYFRGYNTSSTVQWLGYIAPGADMYMRHYYESSDIRLKHDISSISQSIRKFRFNDDNKLYYGFIAQELEKSNPELVDTSGEHWTVNYNSAICYYIAELENKVQKLEDEINKLKNK